MHICTHYIDEYGTVCTYSDTSAILFLIIIKKYYEKSFNILKDQNYWYKLAQILSALLILNLIISRKYKNFFFILKEINDLSFKKALFIFSHSSPIYINKKHFLHHKQDIKKLLSKHNISPSPYFHLYKSNQVV